MKNLAILSFIFILLKINIINNVSAALSSIKIQSKSKEKLVTGNYTIFDDVLLDTTDDDHQQTDLCASASASGNVSSVKKSDSFNITKNTPFSLSTKNTFSVCMNITTKDGHHCGTLSVTKSIKALPSSASYLLFPVMRYQYMPANEAPNPGCNNSTLFIALSNASEHKQITKQKIFLTEEEKYSVRLFDHADTLWNIIVSDQ